MAEARKNCVRTCVGVSEGGGRTPADLGDALLERKAQRVVMSEPAPVVYEADRGPAPSLDAHHLDKRAELRARSTECVVSSVDPQPCDLPAMAVGVVDAAGEAQIEDGTGPRRVAVVDEDERRRGSCIHPLRFVLCHSDLDTQPVISRWDDFPSHREPEERRWCRFNCRTALGSKRLYARR